MSALTPIVLAPRRTLILIPQNYQDYVVLGSQQFIDQPVVTQTNASVNFFDNHADNGGSPPGGPD